MTVDKVGAVAVIGGGIAGTQAAIDLAESGFRVYLVERSPSLGGAMAQLDKTFPTNDCAMCILAPKLVEAGRHQNITLITNAEVVDIDGVPGAFWVTVRKRPRFVDETKCTGCGICTQRCPIEVPDEFNKGLKLRKAIYVKYPQAVPPTHTIDQEHCIGCGICEKQCEAGAINYAEKETLMDLNVGAVILAPGFQEFDPGIKKEYGYGIYPNVVTSLDLERMLVAVGPYGGMVLRPSDGRVPKKIAFIQCVGSRDREINERYCSAVCCMFAVKEAIIAQEHMPGLKPYIFFMDLRAFGKEFDDYYIRAEEEHGIKFILWKVSNIEQVNPSKNLRITYEDWDGNLHKEEFDMVVLSVGMRPPKDVEDLARRLKIDLNHYGFCRTPLFAPIETSRPGVYVCGSFVVPQDIPDSVAQASGAAARASAEISSARGKLVSVKTYPEERDVSTEEPRIGVFVCHCGINIGGVVNVPEVEAYARTLPGVAHAECNLYTCSFDTQAGIKEKIKQLGLNRVVVASCTPRTHGPLFMNTVREAGLNPYLFEMANIREHCSWVHSTTPKEATEKAKELVRMAVAKVRLLKPLKPISIPILKSGLVIGGGITGLNAALGLAEQGFDAYLVEKSRELGGLTRQIHFELGGQDVQAYMKDLIERVCTNPRIKVFTGARIKSFSGYVGNFQTTIALGEGGEGEKEATLNHGVVIVATGGEPLKTTEYGKHPNIMTVLELEGKLARGEIDVGGKKTFVMIQCVGSRERGRTYCSRVCCTETIKNALKIKELNPGAPIYILAKDMRTYGFREDWFRKARDEGVVFIRYDNASKPSVRVEGKDIVVVVNDRVVGRPLRIRADYLALAVATVPPAENEELAKMLKVPLSKDRFFLEAHMKLRPLDFASEGIFLAGLAHSPKFIEECIYQAYGAVSRASTILSRDRFEGEGITSRVDEEKCTGCRTCEFVCPYGAIKVDPERTKAVVTEVLCKGCGTCSAACPKKAITMEQFTTEQIMKQIDALTEGA
ncbi:MAG: FAD-dependent oxidoreductase [Thermoplasmatota archaeon]